MSKYTPRNYQLIGRDFLRQRKFAMLGDACGVGKTGQALLAIDPSWKVLVVCPASVQQQWFQAAKDWDALPNNIFWVISYDSMIRDTHYAFIIKHHWDVIIFDEAHRLKSLSAKRTKKALGKNGLRSKANRIWFLTGTPVKNRTIDLYPILRSCAPEVLGKYDSYLKFAYRYCGAYQGRFGMDVSGASHTEELHERMKSFMLRREKRDVLTELPPRVITKVDLPCSPEALELIKQEEQKTIEQAGENDPALFKLGEIARIRQTLSKYKVPASVAYIKDLLEEEEKIIVFYYHKEILSELRRALLSIPSVFIDGSVAPARRGGIVEDFKSREDVRIFFGQMAACGEGIDGLQESASCCVFVEPSWSHTDIEQCIGRLERSGQRSDVNVHILTIKDTLEAKMMDVVQMKLNVDKKLYNQTKENPMVPGKTEKAENPKQNKEIFVRLVDLLESLTEVLKQQTALLEKLNLPTTVKQEMKNYAVEDVAQTKAITKQKAQVVEPTPEADVTIDALRNRAADLCAIRPDGVGKAEAARIINKIGGGKLIDLKTPEQRKQCLKEFDAAYADLSATIGAVKSEDTNNDA